VLFINIDIRQSVEMRERIAQPTSTCGFIRKGTIFLAIRSNELLAAVATILKIDTDRAANLDMDAAQAWTVKQV